MPDVRPAPILLRYDDTGQSVVVVPDDEDRFVISVAEAVKACRVFDQLGVVRFKEQFQQLLTKLGSWVTVRQARISHAIVTTRDAGLLFLVCTKAPVFDSEIEDELTDLDLEIANDSDLDLIRLSVLAIPDDSEQSISCFADPSNTWRYGE